MLIGPASRSGDHQPIQRHRTHPVVNSQHEYATRTPRTQSHTQNPLSSIPPHVSGRLSREQSQSSSDNPVVPPGLGLEAESREENITLTILDATKVTFGPGFGVIEVKTGFESRQILLENVPATIAPVDITAALSIFGEVIAVLPVDPNEGSSSAYKVTFARGESAINAAAAVDSSELFAGSEVKACMTVRNSTGIGGGKLYDGDVLFELPTARQKGYVGYETKEKAEKAIALAQQKGMKGMRVTAQIYEGIPVVGAVNVRFENLPGDASAKDLARYGPYETHMLDRPKYNWTVNAAVDGLRRMLEGYGDVYLNVLPPPYNKTFRVWAHFKDPRRAAAAQEALDRFCPRFVGKQRIFAHHVRSILYNLPADVFDILAYDINLLRSYHCDEYATSISVFDRRIVADPKAPVQVKLVSRNMSSLTKLKAAFDRLLRGEKVTDSGQTVWNDFFGGPAGQNFLDDLEKAHPTVRINRDTRRRTLALFGPQADRAHVNAEIVTRAKLLQAQRKHRYSVASHLIGVFMSEDLPSLQKELGRENVWFDLTNRQLVVCGDPSTQKVARLVVQQAGKRQRKRNSRGDAGCPVCFGEVSQPVSLMCGHTWCQACLVGYMHASVDSRSFPLTCLGDEAKCTHHIPLSVAQQLLSPDEFDAIVNASFLAHVQLHPDEFHYCPTPDCPQVYRKSGPGAVLQCPSCLVRICSHCNMEYHESRSCQDQNPEDERLFERWKLGHDVKDCPSCKVPIERMAGCNHMTCTSCQTHICWACLATFSTSQQVYSHMRSIHGGIGL
ncbi:hypothetical protein BD311DRAFT_703528 [Dichomitus squalens]|uniref:RBR-type E3 ubiquitin transferase n=1 Tax=Dichomitus squalens TaxID=114155 RepID=A0A4Q9MCU9_9APHY|nr:hypothetical protein BD311DRAFT_703528 [Dichomitus squalens]